MSIASGTTALAASLLASTLSVSTVAAVPGSDPVRELVGKIQTETDPNARSKAFTEIKRCGPDALPVLFDLLEHGTPTEQALAINALGLLAPQYPQVRTVTPTIIALLQSDTLAVRRNAALMLAKQGDAVSDAIPLMIAAATRDTTDTQTRQMMAAGLAEMGPSVLPHVQKLLRDPDVEIRWLAATTIARMGEAGRPAMPDVVTALRDESPSIRAAAAGTLLLIGVGESDQAAVRGLADALAKDDTSWVREKYLFVLERLGPAAKSAVPELTRAADDDNRQVRAAAVKALKAVQAE